MKAIRVQFKKTGKRYYFSPGKYQIKSGDHVVVNTIHGIEVGTVSGDVIDIDMKSLESELKEIIRPATEEDINNNKTNQEASREVITSVKAFAKQVGLDIKILQAEYTLDKAKLTIYFESEDRIDFRELVRLIADKYHTRIEMRQVGSRDGAKEIGGIGPCGLVMCCKTFLTEFNNVSIKMAKNQGLSLNPTKISGNCGKLLCCISYENDFYTKLRENAPDINDIVEAEKGEAKVLSVDVLNRTCKIKYLADESFAYPHFEELKLIRKRKSFNQNETRKDK